MWLLVQHQDVSTKVCIILKWLLFWYPKSITTETWVHDLRKPNNFGGPSNNCTSHPRVNLLFARGSDDTRVNFRLAWGPGTPRVAFCLARGASAAPPGLRLTRGSPSTRGALPAPPDRGIIAPSRRGSHGQKTDPRHVDSLTPPGNLAPALRLVCRCCTIPGAVWVLHTRCVERPGSITSTMSPAPVLPPRRARRKGMGTPSRGVRPVTKFFWNGYYLVPG
jgi:hypothetical protein